MYIMISLRHLCLFLNLWQMTRADLTPQEIHSWNRLRGAVVQTDIFLQGGLLQIPQSKTGYPGRYENGSFFRLSLNDSFDVADNQAPPLFRALDDKRIEGSAIGQDGFMIADNDEIYVYGGAFSNPALVDNVVFSDVLFDPTIGRENTLRNANPAYRPNDGAFQVKLTAGAGANAPSESRGFYFGGLKRPDNQAIGVDDGIDNLTLSDGLVIVDTTEQTVSHWTIPALGVGIQSRAEATLAWIPAGEQGMLVAVGGVLNPSDIFSPYGPWTNDSMEQGNNFTKEIHLFDVASSTWFRQAIADGSPCPPRLARACGVVSTHFKKTHKADSHHDIFLYGGYDGDSTTSFDSVWVLSIPSFRFIELPAGRTRRDGHICVKPYDNQMIVIGGTQDGTLPLEDGRLVDVFDMNTLEWTGRYDPLVHDDYIPAEVIVSALPQDQWANVRGSPLAVPLNTTYDVDKLIALGPYTKSSPTPRTGGPEDRTKSRDLAVKAGVPVGVIVGLSIIALLFFCLVWRPRRRKLEQIQGHKTGATDETAQSWIDRWVGSTVVGSTQGKDVNSDTDGAGSVPEAAQTPELDGLGYASTHRWSQSTAAARPPRHRDPGSGEGPYEVYTPDHRTSQTSGIHTIASDGAESPNVSRSDVRKQSTHAPGVVSGGQAPSEMSDAGAAQIISDTGAKPDKGAMSASPSSHNPAAARSSKAKHISSISETAAFETTAGATTGSINTKRSPISPVQWPARPSHHRHSSSVSSGLSPLPSPGEEQEEDEQIRTI
ncbi:uncharacterized protein AB675_5666 [Cyphellophora attinorum]|uniref:Kelch repeat-containing protein n=1 Tax=Cyphellophora attinorum TaxID=1664694 RepID=A0A0N1P0D7_9EURO|nr:uncharacterized protein AB675_5666 [Phialophora attinorum]KPI42067.1 hypothetical protein AB675_5666 [Phialophora attinorum]